MHTDHEVEFLQKPMIEESLSRVLQSSQFKDAVQLQTLLRYIVENSIRGQDEALKERIIGMSVFGRKADYDTTIDPIVRSRMGQLRKRLARFYEDEESAGCAVQIVIPSGSYRPSFAPLHEASKGHKDSAFSEEPPPLTLKGSQKRLDTVHPPSRAAQWRIGGVIILVVCAVAAIGWFGIETLSKNELNLFWGPIFKSQKPVLIYYGVITAYIPSPSFINKIPSMKPSDDSTQPGTDARIPSLVEGQVLTASDLFAVRDGFTTPGDLSAAVDVATLLKGHHESFDLRSGPDLPFADLHRYPTVLIGASNNFWTMQLTGGLPFYFDRLHRIRERGGQGRVWSDNAAADSEATEDYAIVYRLLDSKTGEPVVAIAGIRTCGTRAGGEFATDPAQLKKLKMVAQDALARENLELVLHVSLVNCNPTSMEIAALKSW